MESNDRLYGGDKAYMEKLGSYVETLMNEILGLLTQLGEAGDLDVRPGASIPRDTSHTVSPQARKQQGTLALDFLNVIIGCLEMNPHSATLVVRLYQLAVKSGAVAPAYLRGTLSHIQSKRGAWYSDIVTKLTSSE